MYTFGQRLVASREKRNLSQKELAEKLGITPTRLNYWEKDKREPAIEMIKAIAQVLDVDTDYLIGHQPQNKNAPLFSSEAQKLAADYDSLDTYGKRSVRAVADVEKARCAEAAQTAPARELDETVYYITSWFHHPMSAGTGEHAERDQPESLRLIKEPPRGTSYVAPVHGDSMEPTYHDGDKLFIHACEEIESGQIGVFYMDGQQWVKELGDGELISHNPGYPPRPMTEDIRCQGLVLGVCDDSYFE